MSETQTTAAVFAVAASVFPRLFFRDRGSAGVLRRAGRAAVMRADIPSSADMADSTFTDAIMKSLGRTLQVIGLILLPLSMVMELSGGLARSFGVSDMVIMLVFGAAAFTIGRFLEGYSTGAPRR